MTRRFGPLEETPQWENGYWAEGVAKRYALANGYAVHEVSPLGARNRVELPDGRTYPAEDFYAVRHGGIKPVQVKYKNCPDLYQKHHSWRHGMDLRLWDWIVGQMDQYGVAPEIWLVELRRSRESEPEPWLLIADAADIRPFVQRVEDGESSYKPMAYWDRDVMTERYVLPDTVGEPPHELPRRQHAWEDRGRDGAIPKPSATPRPVQGYLPMPTRPPAGVKGWLQP